MHYTPVNEFKSTKYGSNRWFTYSPKVHRIVNLYSDLEFDHWVLVEFNPNVLSFCEQPRRINGVDKNGNKIDSIFDMWCREANDKSYYTEVKYHRELDPFNAKYSERSAKQVDFQRSWCELNGFQYMLQTDEDIYKNKMLLSNYKKMLPYIDDQRTIIETDQYRIMSSIKSFGSVTIGMVVEDTKLPLQRVKEVIYRLIYNGCLNSDVDHNIVGSTTEVTFR